MTGVNLIIEWLNWPGNGRDLFLCTMEVCIQDERPQTSIFRTRGHAKAELRFSEGESVLVGLNQIRMSEVTSYNETYETCTLCGQFQSSFNRLKPSGLHVP
jgi:hypothetical protein